MLRGCRVYVICDSSSFHFFTFNVCYDCSQNEHVHHIFGAHFIIFLGVLN